MYQRKEYIDILRGIAILLVVMGHCSPMNILNKTLLSFHMPLFFFISGMCLNVNWGGDFFIKKLRTIGVPQLTLVLLNCIVGIFVDVFVLKRYTLSEADWYGAVMPWFLPTLMLMFYLLYPIIKYCKSNKAIYCVTLLIVLCFCLIDNNEVYIIQQVLCALVFGLLGYLFRNSLDRWTVISSNIKGCGWILLIVVAIIADNKEPVLMYINQYGNKMEFFLIATIGVLATFEISSNIKSAPLLSYIGRNSVIVYIFHFSVIKIVRAFTNRLSLESFNNPFLLFVVVFFITILIVQIVNKYALFIVGKQNHPN